jgi:hypothetical protein
VVEEPVLEESVLEEPVLEESVVEEPVIEEPVLEEPVVEEPVIEESVIEEPVVEEPVVEESVTVEEPVVEEPVIEESVLEEHIVEESVTVEEPVLVAKIPKLVFIVPYRDREQQLLFFEKHMKEILADYDPEDYKIYIIHQTDKREFNRGALKNIGFLLIKEKYPKDYQNITIVFNDVDTMPLNKNFFHYETTPGTVKHFYGYTFALGGIVSINAKDLESINGYPNLWAWGFEDNMLQHRVLNHPNLTIDRSEFYPLLDKNVLQLKDGLERLVNRGEFDRYIAKTPEGIDSIRSLIYQINENSGYVNVIYFETGVQMDPSKNQIHDLRKGNRPFFPIPKKTGKLPRIQMKFF